MTRIVLAAALLAAGFAPAGAAGEEDPAPVRRRVLVELFTSQG